jgi:hypothetical protein
MRFFRCEFGFGWVVLVLVVDLVWVLVALVCNDFCLFWLSIWFLFSFVSGFI